MSTTGTSYTCLGTPLFIIYFLLVFVSPYHANSEVVVFQYLNIGHGDTRIFTFNIKSYCYPTVIMRLSLPVPPLQESTRALPSLPCTPTHSLLLLMPPLHLRLALGLLSTISNSKPSLSDRLPN